MNFIHPISENPISKVFCMVIAFSLNTLFVHSQCTADAGLDTIFCGFNYDYDNEPFIGGSPAATNGNEPYVYVWSTVSSSFTASEILNDTNVANPRLSLPSLFDSAVLQLTVIDNTGDTCRDTVSVYLCYFDQPLGDDVIYIEEGDTIQLPGVTKFDAAPFCPPEYSFYFKKWKTDNTHISDTLAHNASVWPEEQATFTPIFETDDGCEIMGTTIRVLVDPVSAPNVFREEIVSLYPNPTRNEIRIAGDQSEQFKDYRILSIDGRLVKSGRLNNEKVIQAGELSPGLYVVVLLHDEGSITRKIVIE